MTRTKGSTGIRDGSEITCRGRSQPYAANTSTISMARSVGKSERKPRAAKSSAQVRIVAMPSDHGTDKEDIISARNPLKCAIAWENKCASSALEHRGVAPSYM